jgi:hypothetical protein
VGGGSVCQSETDDPGHLLEKLFASGAC